MDALTYSKHILDRTLLLQFSEPLIIPLSLAKALAVL